MRTTNTIKNTIISLVFQMVVLGIGIVVPRWILSVYGSEINGLTSNITQILNILNLLQAGMIGASIFEMYSPIVNEDYHTIGSIFYSAKYHFNKLSVVFFFLSLLMIPYFLSVNDNDIRFVYLVLSVFIFAINGTVLFKYYCSYDIIFSAYQKKYILILASLVEKTIYYILLFFVLFYRLNFVFMYLSVLIGSISKIIYLNYKFNKQYANKLSKYKEEKKYKVKNQYKLFGNQVVQQIIETSPILLITSFYGLVYASIYSIYTMITSIYKMVFSTLQNSIAASFGDLVAHKDIKKNLLVFDIIQFGFAHLNIILTSCLGILLFSFVGIYTNQATEIVYAYKTISLGITLYIACYNSFLPFNMMINSYGLYGSVTKYNIVIGLISFICTILLALFDFQLVFFGISIFYIISIINRIFVLKEESIIVSKKIVFRTFLSILFPMVFSIVSFIVYPLANSWIEWLFSSLLSFCCIVLIDLVYCLFFEKDQIKNLYYYIKRLKRRNR